MAAVQVERRGRKGRVKVEEKSMVVTGGKGWEEEPRGQRQGVRGGSQGEARTGGEQRGIWAGLPGVREQRDRPQSGKDSVRGWEGRNCGSNDRTRPTVTSDVFVEACQSQRTFSESALFSPVRWGRQASLSFIHGEPRLSRR